MTQPSASISLQVMPKVRDDKEAIKIIDRVIAMIQTSGVRYEVGPMETTMEGELKVLLEIVKKAQLLCIEAGAERIFSNVKIMYSPQGVMTIDEKVTKFRA